MSKMSELHSEQQQAERLTDVTRPPTFEQSARAGTAVHTTRRPQYKLEDLHVPTHEYPYALGYIGRSHTIAIERLDALLACPGDKRTLLKTIAAIRGDLADDVENLRGVFERRAAIAAAKGGA